MFYISGQTAPKEKKPQGIGHASTQKSKDDYRPNRHQVYRGHKTKSEEQIIGAETYAYGNEKIFKGRIIQNQVFQGGKNFFHSPILPLFLPSSRRSPLLRSSGEWPLRRRRSLARSG